MHVHSDGHRCRNLMLFGDQLTVERATADQKARIASNIAVKGPDGLEPPATDQHAEANFLQVSMHVHAVMIEKRYEIGNGCFKHKSCSVKHARGWKHNLNLRK